MGDGTEIVRRYIDLMNQRDFDGLEAVLTEDHVWHAVAAGVDRRGVDGFREVIERYTASLPDMVMTIHHIFGDGRMVGVRLTHAGTHTEDGGWARLAPTGKPLEFVMHLHARLEGDRIAEVWETWDRAVMNEQLGLT